MEGLERTILCRDEEDYDAMVKILCVSARRKIVVMISRIKTDLAGNGE